MIDFRWSVALLLCACSASSGGASGPPGGGAGTDSDAGGGGGGAATNGGATTNGGASNEGGGFTVGGTVGASGGAPAAAGGAPTNGGGASACDPPDDAPRNETCNGLDDDLDGFVDETGCDCSPGSSQPCFDGPPSLATAGNCHEGTQTCVLSGEFGEWGPCEGSGCDDITRTEVCDNGVDDDCDGSVDEGCALDAEVNLDGDCLSAFCPPQAPNPIGCQITMEGDDSRGCVSHAPGSAEVYFQEGNVCPVCIPIIGCTGGAGRVSGTLRCSSSPTPVPLDATNCIINKSEPAYATPSSTPITQPVSGCAQ